MSIAAQSIPARSWQKTRIRQQLEPRRVKQRVGAVADRLLGRRDACTAGVHADQIEPVMVVEESGQADEAERALLLRDPRAARVASGRRTEERCRPRR